MNILSRLTLLIGLVLSCSVYSASSTFETVAAYGESSERAIRWADGTVRVWDNTGLLDKHPEILRILNKNLGDVRLERTNFKKISQVRIEWVDILPAPHAMGCALAINKFVNDHEQIGESIVLIRRNNQCLGPTEGAALLIHELGHVLGFAKHPREGDVMSIRDGSFERDEISLSILQHFLKGLYSLPVGSTIPRNELMPAPAPESLTWRTRNPPVTLKEVGQQSFPSKVRSSTPQPQVVFPNMSMRKIKRQTDRGETWEFVPIEQIQTDTVVSNGAAQPFEMIIPGRPTIRSNLDIIVPRP